jgi:hypothetical protein
VEQGYVDLEQDDYDMGTLLDKLQVGGFSTTHRAAPPSGNK